MIQGVFKVTEADYAIAISGIAGPGGATLEKPVGTICIAIGKRNDVVDAGIVNLQGNRELIIEEATNISLAILYRRIAHNFLYFEE